MISVAFAPLHSPTAPRPTLDHAARADLEVRSRRGRARVKCAFTDALLASIVPCGAS